MIIMIILIMGKNDKKNDKKHNSSSSSSSLSDIDDDSISVDSEDDDNATSKVEVTREFQENVIKFVKIDDLIRKKTEEISDLKKQKKQTEEFILTYLEKNDETTIDITNGKLIKSKSETKTALTQDIIENALKDKISDPMVISDIIKMMNEKRPLKVHTNIKRTSSKAKKNKTVVV